MTAGQLNHVYPVSVSAKFVVGLWWWSGGEVGWSAVRGFTLSFLQASFLENYLSYKKIFGWGAHWALEYSYITLLPKKIISELNRLFDLMFTIIKISPKFSKDLCFGFERICLEIFRDFF